MDVFKFTRIFFVSVLLSFAIVMSAPVDDVDPGFSVDPPRPEDPINPPVLDDPSDVDDPTDIADPPVPDAANTGDQSNDVTLQTLENRLSRIQDMVDEIRSDHGGVHVTFNGGSSSVPVVTSGRSKLNTKIGRHGQNILGRNFPEENKGYRKTLHDSNMNNVELFVNMGHIEKNYYNGSIGRRQRERLNQHHHHPHSHGNNQQDGDSSNQGQGDSQHDHSHDHESEHGEDHHHDHDHAGGDDHQHGDHDHHHHHNHGPTDQQSQEPQHDDTDHQQDARKDHDHHHDHIYHSHDNNDQHHNHDDHHHHHHHDHDHHGGHSHEPTNQQQQQNPQLGGDSSQSAMAAMAATSHQQHGSGTVHAHCEMAANRAIIDDIIYEIQGSIHLSQQKMEDPIVVDLNLKDGESSSTSAIHLHSLGDLSRGCNSLGSHYNPSGGTHGPVGDEHSHVGDIGNINFDEDGNVVSQISFQGGCIKDLMGRSLVIHENADTYDDSSDSGRRIACCIIGWSEGH